MHRVSLNDPSSFPIVWLARSHHLGLVGMHVISTLNQIANTAKYLLPVSDVSCVATHRTMLAMLLLFDVSEVLTIFVG